MHKKIILKNGLRIITNDMQHMESVSIGIWLACGGRYEKKEHAGISHFLEHILFKGTHKRSARQIKEDIEGIGGSLNGFTSEEFTCYLAKSTSKYSHLCLDVLSDMVISPRIDESDVNKERNVILEEIKMYYDMPSHYVHDLLNELLWPDQPLGMHLTGTYQTVNSILTKDIRDYKESHYIPSNIVIAACGKLDHDKLVSDAAKLFKDIPKQKSIIPEKAGTEQLKPRFNIHFKETEQIHLSLGMHAMHREHRDKYALTLLHIILGANMSSRLFQEIREKRGLAYDVGTHINRHNDTGAFVVDAGTDINKVTTTIEVILEELEKIKNENAGDSEMRRAKDFFIGQFLMALEETSDHMLWLGENLTASNKVYDKNEILRRVRDISASDIRRVANSVIQKEKCSLAVIGPIKDKEKKKIEGLFR